MVISLDNTKFHLSISDQFHQKRQKLLTSNLAVGARGKISCCETRGLNFKKHLVHYVRYIKLSKSITMNFQNHKYISSGNDTFDRFLGGGLINGTFNIFEREGPSSRILDKVWNKSFAASTIASEGKLIIVNFNTNISIEKSTIIAATPQPRKVNQEILYKDVRGKSQAMQIKIAWRYTKRSSSPENYKTNQIDFGHANESLPEDSTIEIINISKDFTLQNFLKELRDFICKLKIDNTVNIIIQDVLHPFSPVIDNTDLFIRLIYSLRCLARTLGKGAILMSYDICLFDDHSRIKQQVYNIADGVVSFFSYETDENRTTYKNFDGTISYVKIPKINTFGLHFQQELSDWGYRFTRNHRYFVVDELSLPPCDDDEDDTNKPKKHIATDVTKIGITRDRIEKVGPLEDFKEVAGDVLAKQL